VPASACGLRQWLRWLEINGGIMEYLLMLAFAFGVGAAHALEPGHGKTVVAAYLVGSRGRTLDAVVLGGVVTFTHTFSVYILAIASTVAAAYLVPNQVEHWLAISSGLLVVAVGLWMIYVRTKYGPPVHSHSHGGHSHNREAHGHSHVHRAQAHDHGDADDGHNYDRGHGGQDHDHDHPHPHPHPHPVAQREGPGAAAADVGQSNAGSVGLGSLVALGVSGGIVPCPAALALIPAAIGLGAVLKGLGLIVSFSLGLALVLMAIGILTLKAAGFASGWLERGDWTRRISIASAYFIALLGLALTVKAFLIPPAVH
jgi:nickel/cobalt exporter